MKVYKYDDLDLGCTSPSECVLCGREVKNPVTLWTDGLYVTEEYNEELYEETNGGGCMDISVGSECVHKIINEANYVSTDKELLEG